MIRNLGQVAAIYIGSSAPRNTNLIWLDNTVVPFVFRAYDGSAWSEIATHKWVRAYVDGWLVTLPPRQLADDGDYMLINSNNVNYKITVKDFVKSAVGNPLDFKGVIRTSADFPNPSTLESGDMYVIITSPAGGTVTDPYSGKTFEDSEKIVWDEVTQSWESLGKIDITVDLTTSYSETEVTIHSSAGKETTIQGATDQLAGVMLPGQYSWLQALSNGSIVPGDPSPLTPLTPAHKHNYNDIINRLVSQQGTGESTIDPMSQKATTDALNLKFDKASVLQVSGAATDKVMSQKAVTDALKTLSDDFNNKLTNYLPLVGGTMTGSIRFPIGKGIVCGDVAGTAAYVVLRTWNANNSTRMYVGTVNFPTYISSTASDLIHDRNGSSYLLWDSYNLLDPAKLSADQTFTGLNTFTKKITVGSLTPSQILLDPSNEVVYRYVSTEVSRGYSISLGTLNNIRKFTYGGYYSASKNDEYAYLSLPTQSWDSSSYKFYADKLAVPKVWSLTDGTVDAITLTNSSTTFGRESTPLRLRGDNTDLIYYRGNNTYKIWDKFNLSDPATLSGDNTFTGNNTFQAGKFNVGPFQVTSSGSLLLNINLQEGSAWSRSLTFRANNDNTSSFVFGGYNSIDNTSIGYAYIGIGNVSHNTAQYKFYSNQFSVSSTMVVPESSFRIFTGNSTLFYHNQSEKKVKFGNSDSSVSLELMAKNLYHSKYDIASSTWKNYTIYSEYNLPTPASTTDLANYLPLAGGTLTGQVIFDSYGLAFNNIAWTNDLVPNRTYGGYLQVLDAYNASSDGGPTNYGTVLQINSRIDHWANQLWFGNNDNMYLRRMNYGSTTYGEWNRLLTNKDVNIIQTQSSSNPSTLPVNQIFYSEIQRVDGTPTVQGALFSVQGDDEGIQLWASSSKTELYYRTKWTSFGNWIKLAATSDLNSYLTKTEASTLYYPYNGRGYLSITSSGKPVMSNNQGYAVKDKDGNEREVLWMGTDNTLNLGNTSQYTLNKLDLRCTTLTHNGSSIATQNYVTNQLSNYLPLTGGTLSGNLTINTVGSTTFVINNNDTNGSETFMRVLRKGTASAAIGFRDSLGAYIYNYNSNKYLFIDNDGYARVGTTSGSTRLALITDIPTVSGYLPLSGGILTGALTMNSRRHNIVVDVVGGAGNTWDEGAGALSIQVPNDSGQTPLILARRSGAAINTTAATERLLSMELLDTGHSFIIGMSGSKALQLDWTSGKVGTGKLFGKTIATTDQIPSIPSISISNSGTGNAVTAISASGHTLTVTKGATYLTSSSLDGYATQSWANGQFAPLSRFNISTGYTTIKVVGQEFNFDSNTPEIYMNYRTLSGSTAVTKITWKGGSNSTLCEGRWGNLYMNDNLVATQTWSNSQYPLKTGTGASGTWGISITGNATTATTASKLGSTTIGGSAKPIYLSSGTPTACSATVGSATVPVYMNAGTITQCSTTLGVSITGNAATATNSTQLGGTAASSYVKANDNISRLTNDSGYTTQEWVNSQNFVKSTSTKKVTDIQPVDALPATQASGVLYLVFG